MSAPLTQLELRHMVCHGCSSNGRMYFHARCHPRSPTWCSYENGVLKVDCATCMTPVTQVAVASAPAATPPLRNRSVKKARPS